MAKRKRERERKGGGTANKRKRGNGSRGMVMVLYLFHKIVELYPLLVESWMITRMNVDPHERGQEGDWS